MCWKFRFRITKQLRIFNIFILPSSITVGIEKGFSNHFSLMFYLPLLEQRYSHDLGDDNEYYGIRFPTEIIFVIDKRMYWGFWIKILGFGVGFHRQWSY